jgi:hypothetical protein
MRGYVADTRWRFGKERGVEDRGAVMSVRAERERERGKERGATWERQMDWEGEGTGS